MENANPADETALIKRWVETWKFAGPELERIKKEELRAMTDREAAADAEMILSVAVDDWTPESRKVSSGLVEQQRLFGNWKIRE